MLGKSAIITVPIVVSTFLVTYNLNILLQNQESNTDLKGQTVGDTHYVCCYAYDSSNNNYYAPGSEFDDKCAPVGDDTSLCATGYNVPYTVSPEGQYNAMQQCINDNVCPVASGCGDFVVQVTEACDEGGYCSNGVTRCNIGNPNACGGNPSECQAKASEECSENCQKRCTGSNSRSIASFGGTPGYNSWSPADHSRYPQLPTQSGDFRMDTVIGPSPSGRYLPGETIDVSVTLTNVSATSRTDGTVNDGWFIRSSLTALGGTFVNLPTEAQLETTVGGIYGNTYSGTSGCYISAGDISCNYFDVATSVTFNLQVLVGENPYAHYYGYGGNDPYSSACGQQVGILSSFTQYCGSFYGLHCQNDSALFSNRSWNAGYTTVLSCCDDSPWCGDDTISGSETCDGTTFDTSPLPHPATCRARDTLGECTYCGDGNTDTDAGEQCDDGNGEDFGDTCHNDCTFTVCGDGVVQSPNGEGINETCDHSAADPGNCRLGSVPNKCTYCGDGNPDSPSEDCDDGVNDSSTLCGPGCVFTTCGDGTVQSPNGDGSGINDGMEQCDFGKVCASGPQSGQPCLTNTDCGGPHSCVLANPEKCNDQCQWTFCGDGTPQDPNGVGDPEDCDDANTNPGDECTDSCEHTFCGDGIVQSPNGKRDGFNTGFEQCESDTDCNTTAPQECSNCECVFICGNGTLDSGETCDPNAPGAPASCRAALDDNPCTYCGDSNPNSPSEACDEGTANSATGKCTTACTQTFCGDNTTQKPNGSNFMEDCDNGADNNECVGCKWTTCGDGVTQSPNGLGESEDCDDSNSIQTDRCKNDCTWAACGDGHHQPKGKDGIAGTADDEQCDNGAANGPLAECNTDCTFTFCGDGQKQNPNGNQSGINDGDEQCDEGLNNHNNRQCLPSCATNVCGDGFELNTPPTHPNFEECDEGSANNSDTTPDACRTNCKDPFCGDTIKDSGETCDAGAPANSTHNPSNGSCRAAGDPEECTYCGDGSEESSEECDHGATNAADGECTPNTCTLTFCGDGTLQTPNGKGINDGDPGFNEICEPGIVDCPEGRECVGCVCVDLCGNGRLDTAEGETCDNSVGEGNPGYEEGCRSPGAQDECTFCGDNDDSQDGEACDDGNDSNADGCLNDCSLPSCGDGHTREDITDTSHADYEECDEADQNADDGVCTTDCRFTFCGDGTKQIEQCTGGTCKETNTCSASGTADSCIMASIACAPGETLSNGPVCNDEPGCMGNTICCLTAEEITTGVTCCALNQVCRTDPGEGCDEGANNSDTGKCSTQCQPTFCGDDEVQSPNGEDPEINEVCDDGPLNSDSNGCTASCQPASCGDELVRNGDLSPGDEGYEECDDGSLNDPLGSCSTSCKLTTCGDEAIQPMNGQGIEEECDDGANNADTAECSSGCKETFCGDGITQVQNGRGEGGPDNDGVEECDGESNCTVDCKWTICGDGNAEFGEECNEPNRECPEFHVCIEETCLCDPPLCGNSELNEVSETCDFRATPLTVDNPAEITGPRACREIGDPGQCTYCGDTMIQADAGEECDDPGFIGCSDDCKEVTYCGDGDPQSPNEAGNGGPLNDGQEECDQGESNSDTTPNACRTNCVLAHCGDSVEDSDEECDLGDGVNSDTGTCNTSCNLTFCGDEIKQSPNGKGEDGPDDDGMEECDGGSDCNPNCTWKIEFITSSLNSQASSLSSTQSQESSQAQSSQISFGVSSAFSLASLPSSQGSSTLQQSSQQSSEQFHSAASQGSSTAASSQGSQASSSGPSSVSSFSSQSSDPLISSSSSLLASSDSSNVSSQSSDSPIVTFPFGHTICNSFDQCEAVPGSGTDECSQDADCVHTVCNSDICETVSGPGVSACGDSRQCITGHLECVSGVCLPVPGEGDNLCNSLMDCCIQDGSCPQDFHTECVGLQCVTLPGAGTDECSDEIDCAHPLQHTECDNRQCITVDGPGSNECIGDEQCRSMITHTVCDRGMCVPKPGPGTNECTTAAQCNPQSHLQCINNQCISVPGSGTNSCSDHDDCSSTISQSHLECIGLQCVLIAGPGATECLNESDCLTLKEHTECKNRQCITVNGPGTNECINASDCERIPDPGHLECRDEQCIPVDGAGSNECINDSDCIPRVTPHGECENGMCVQKTTPGSNECINDDDCSPPQTHLECHNSQCITVEGPGTNECINHSDCLGTPHTECQGGMCIVTVGLGTNECSNDDDCIRTIRGHTQCRNQQCITIDGSGPNHCINDSDCLLERNEYTVCADLQCILVPGSGENQCLNHDDCTIAVRSTAVGASIICGDGLVEYPEECDDGNNRDSDGCSSLCRLEVGVCGDGIIQRALGEQCEDILHSAHLAYRCENCRFLSRSCGDSTLDPGEECDRGKDNADSADSLCREDCSLQRCGDGILDSTEECDDGNTLNTDSCSDQCTIILKPAAPLEANITLPSAPPQSPNYQPLPYQIPLQRYTTPRAYGDTGPGAIAVIAIGSGLGYAYVRRRKKSER